MNKEIHALNLQLADLEGARNRARAAAANLREKLMKTDKVMGELYFASGCSDDGHDSKACRMCKHFSKWFAMKEATATDQENPKGGDDVLDRSW